MTKIIRKITEPKNIPYINGNPISIPTKELGFSLSPNCEKEIKDIQEFIGMSMVRGRRYYFD